MQASKAYPVSRVADALLGYDKVVAGSAAAGLIVKAARAAGSTITATPMRRRFSMLFPSEDAPVASAGLRYVELSVGLAQSEMEETGRSARRRDDKTMRAEPVEARGCALRRAQGTYDPSRESARLIAARL